MKRGSRFYEVAQDHDDVNAAGETGEHSELLRRIQAAFLPIAASTPGAALLQRRDDSSEGTATYYVSPDLVVVAKPEIRQYAGVECHAPRREDVEPGPVIGHQGMEHVPFASVKTIIHSLKLGSVVGTIKIAHDGGESHPRQWSVENLPDGVEASAIEDLFGWGWIVQGGDIREGFTSAADALASLEEELFPAKKWLH